MADAVDKANEIAELHLQHALEKHNQQTQKMVNNNPYCDECGDEIPKRRRELLPHALHCVECQQALDAIQRNKGTAQCRINI